MEVQGSFEGALSSLDLALCDGCECGEGEVYVREHCEEMVHGGQGETARWSDTERGEGRDEGQGEMRTFPMYASNPWRRVCVEVELEVGKGKWIGDGVLESVEVGMEAVYDWWNEGG